MVFCVIVTGQGGALAILAVIGLVAHEVLMERPFRVVERHAAPDGLAFTPWPSGLRQTCSCSPQPPYPEVCARNHRPAGRFRRTSAAALKEDRG
jgi:hypothetical protein